MNFTDLLEQQNESGSFDENSIRVFEYTSEGRVKWEVPYQFDKTKGFNNSTNAVGELVFNMNGTTTSSDSRYFFVYFDTEDHYPKQSVTYNREYSYGFGGEEFEVNTTKFNVSVDTKRANTTSGIFQVFDSSIGQNIIDAPETERTAEYVEYRNGSNRFTFNLSKNASFTDGPLRLTVTQRGYPEYYDISDDPTDLYLEKHYRFYDGLGKEGVSFVKVEQQVTNVGSSQETIRSTPAGALAQDINRTLGGVDLTTLTGDETDPYSWRLIQDDTNFVYGGLVNVDESVPNFVAVNSTPTQGRFRLGINLTSTTLEPGDAFSQTSFVSYGRSTSNFRDMKNMFKQSPTIDEFGPETYTAAINGSTNATVYNRNETIKLFGNATSIYPNITEYVNVSLNMNTSDDTDDALLSMEQISNSLWSFNYTLSDTADIGVWTGNFTSFTADRLELDFNYSSFQVTDDYFANLTLNDTIAVENAQTFYGNITLDNYRNDTAITGANISCGYGDGRFYPSQEPEKGLYSLNFTAPSPAGDYILTCNGTRGGNLGQDTIGFRTEVGKVNPNISFIPVNTSVSDITQTDGANRTFTINVTNFADGTAGSANISVAAPQQPDPWLLNKSFFECGNLGPDTFCSQSVETAVPNATIPKKYSINTTAEWENPDGTLNDSKEKFNVDVERNPAINISEQLINGSVGGGQFKDVGNVTATSIGNYNLTNLSLGCSEGVVCNEFDVSFSTPNASNIDVGANISSRVNVSVPKQYAPGNYTGIINATTNNTFDTVPIEIEVIAKTTLVNELNVSGNPTFTADSITQSNGQTFVFESNVTNDGEAFAFVANQSIQFPDTRWNASQSLQECGDIDVNQTCSRPFSFTVANGTEPSASESVDVQTNWSNPDGTYGDIEKTILVEILENPLQNVLTSAVNDTVEAGTEKNIGNISVQSDGNAPLDNITYQCFEGSGAVCDDSDIQTSFNPKNISSIVDGENRTIDVNVSVALGYPAGSYGGKVQINSTGGLSNVSLNVTVPETRSWSFELLNDREKLKPQRCVTSSESVTGNICDARVNNTGNVPINISIDLSPLNTEGNVTQPSTRNLSLDLEESQTFNFSYDVSEDRTVTYNDTYNISANKEAIPNWRTVNITILPSVPPNITAIARPPSIVQNESVALLANVTSATRFNISSADINVTKPTGATVNGTMSRVTNYTNTSLWRLYYPNASILNDTDANTTFRGNYTFNITAEDGVGNTGFNISNFTVLADLQSVIETGQERNLGSNTYLPEDVDNLFFTLSDFTGSGLAEADVNLTLAQRDGSVQRRIPEPGATYATGEDGGLTSTPTFSLTSYPSFGVYDIVADASWADPLTGRQMNHTDNTTIIVERESSLDIDWDAGSAWYPGSNFTVHTVVEEEGRLTDPTGLNISVFDTDGNGLEDFTFNKSDFQRKEEGVYQLREQLPNDADLETYWVRQEVERGPLRTVRFQSFRMVSKEAATKSLFDINVSLLNDSVTRGDDLGFNISLLRKTGQSGDSKVTYWISREGTDYAFVSETLFTPVNTTVTIPRNLPVYEGQSTGQYILNARVEPLESDQSFFANASFRVQEPTQEDDDSSSSTDTRSETVQREVPQDEPPEEDPETDYSIVDAPEAINVVRGQTTRRGLSVANTGDVSINNVSLVIIGIKPSWYSIEPSNIAELTPSNLTTFVVDISPPADAELGDYNSTFLVTSSNQSIEQDFDVTIFASISERVGADIDQLSERLSDLREQVDQLEERGVDVEAVRTIIAEIELRQTQAREAANRSEYEEAVEDISAANSRLREAEETLNRLERTYSERSQLFEFLPLLVGALVVLAIILVTIYIVKVRHVNPVNVVEDRMQSVKVEIQRRRQQEEEDLREEKQKTLELLELLDAQHEEGIMDEDTYQDLYSSAEEKLNRINDQIDE